MKKHKYTTNDLIEIAKFFKIIKNYIKMKNLTNSITKNN